jgi:starch-binding outer membrane protein, SusD/RagB family
MLINVVACKKVTNSVESDLITDELALISLANNEQAIIGAYSAVLPEMDLLLNSTFADEVRVGEFYNSKTTHEWTYSTTDVGIRDNFTAINALYRIADRANRVFGALPKITPANAAEVTKKNQLLGEAYFLRAWAHFQLFRYYCGKYTSNGLAMPYVETPSILPQGRILMGAYFTKLTNDITNSKALLPTTLTDRNRANLQAANALHARIALYQEDWTTAEANATAYINALPLSSRSQFPGIWSDGNNNEVAFQLIRTASVGGRIGSLYRATSPSATNVGSVTWVVSDALFNSYDPVNDIRFSSYLANETLLSSASPVRPSKIVRKYAGSGYGTPNENLNNFKVFRTGEMYLIRAEARAEQNNFTGSNSAETDINDLRAARISGYTPITITSKANAINIVMDERFKELPFEGHRFWDLKRRGLPVIRTGVDIPSAAGTTLAAGNFKFLLPIPQTERQANPLMQQNPGYE